MSTVLFRVDDLVCHNYGDRIVLWQIDPKDPFKQRCVNADPHKLYKRLKKLCKKRRR